MNDKSAERDELTGFLNRNAFEEVFKTLMEKAAGSDTLISLAFLDIDNFLHVNENYGHTTGNQVLQKVAETIKAHIMPEAILVRYGGDEVVVLFPDIAREQAFLMLEKVRQAVETQVMTSEDGDNFHVTISVGVASYPNDGMTESEIFRKADQALYKAKIDGRNTIRLAYEERMAPKTAHFTLTQLERLTKLAKEQGVGEAVLLREALDDLLLKYRD